MGEVRCWVSWEEVCKDIYYNVKYGDIKGFKKTDPEFLKDMSDCLLKRMSEENND